MKKLLFLMLAMSVLVSCGNKKKNPGTISGSVAYQSNAFDPGSITTDSAAMVYFTQNTEVMKLNDYVQAAAIAEKIEAFKYGLELNEGYKAYFKSVGKMKDVATCDKQIEAYGKFINNAKGRLDTYAKDSAEYQKLSEEALKIFNAIKEDPETVAVKSDDKGYYKTEVPAGEYAAIFISGKKKAIAAFANVGSMKIYKATVVEKTESSADAKFDY